MQRYDLKAVGGRGVGRVARHLPSLRAELEVVVDRRANRLSGDLRRPSPGGGEAPQVCLLRRLSRSIRLLYHVDDVAAGHLGAGELAHGHQVGTACVHRVRVAHCGERGNA